MKVTCKYGAKRIFAWSLILIKVGGGGGGTGIILQNLLGMGILRVKEGEHKITDTNVEVGLYVANWYMHYIVMRAKRAERKIWILIILDTR